MSARKIEIMKAEVLRRRAAVSELHFTYTRLLRLLPNLVRRSPAPVATLLDEQFMKAQEALQRLTLVSIGHGCPPRPSLCADAATLLDRLFHADRARNTKTIPGLHTVGAMRAVHGHITREWGKLADTLPEDLLPEFRAVAIELQRQEFARYEELVNLEATLLAPAAAALKEQVRNRRTRAQDGESATAA